MDLLGGYGSGSESDDEPQVALPKVSAAPQPTDIQLQRKIEEQQDGLPASKPQLVAPDRPLVQEEEEVTVGPARPRIAATADEKEIPGISQPEVWSKLPAPKAPVRRVVQLLLPFNKALLEAAEDADDDKPKFKKQKTDAGKSKLLDFLPPPSNSLPSRSRVGGGTLLDLSTPDSSSSKPNQPAQGASANGLKPTNIRKRQTLDDSDDEDPMANFGPMPEAGAYASGPIADEGDEDVANVPETGLDGVQGTQQQGVAMHPSMQYSADAYYVGGSTEYQQYDPNTQQYWQQQQGQQGHGDDPGQALFAQALAAEAERANKRGQAFDMSAIQFKEVNANDLKYVDPAVRESAQAIRAALGAEHAASLRAEAKAYEGDRVAKRKHQIGTLFYNAKMREIDILEGKAASARAKSEAKAKYGW